LKLERNWIPTLRKVSLLLIILTAVGFPQSECDGERYYTEIFPNINVSSNIEYGENITEDILGFEYTQTLYLDVYEPANDSVNERPLIIFMFGGSFVGGSKNSPVMQELCTRYAKMGYVASAIDYRITPTLIWNGSEENAYKAVIKAIHDLKAAIRFFRMNDHLYDDFGIDTSRIYAGGSSAGAIAAVNAAYINNENEIPESIYDFVMEYGGLEGFSGNPGYNSEFNGVVNLCGAIGDSNWIEVNDIPIVSVHGDEDTVVPYADDLVTLFGINLQVYGSFIIHQTMIDLGNESALYTFEGEGHTPYAFSDAYMDVTIEFTREFMYDLVCEDSQSGEITVNYDSDWNLVGLPLVVEDPSYELIFPESIEGTLYSFNGGYVPESDLAPGEGYWLRFPTAGNTIVNGTIIDELNISLNADWNLVSGLSESVSINSVFDPEGIIVPGTLYGFASGYVGTDMLIPGEGYWLRAYQGGTIILTVGGLTKTTQQVFSLKGKANTITINDSELYFGVEVPENERLSYSLPPKPPLGAFDIRFSGDTKLCSTDECIIEVMNNEQPLVVEFDLIDGEFWEIVDENGKVFQCSGVHVLELRSEPKILVLRKSITPQIPLEFALFPAYPNPFNPVTTIQYSIPVQTHRNASLQIYDITGRLVSTLVDKILEPGSHTVQWNANNFSSGVYFAEFVSGDYRQIQKLILLK